MLLKSILKLLAPPLAVLAFTAAVYQGDHVSINFPDGWSTPEADADGIVTSKQGENGANCNVEAKKLDAVANMTMAEINAEFGHVFDGADWADFLGVKPAEITLISSETRPLGDAVFHIATFKVKASPTVNATSRYGFYVLPGRVVMGACYADEALYPIYTTIFENTVSSLRPW